MSVPCPRTRERGGESIGRGGKEIVLPSVEQSQGNCSTDDVAADLVRRRDPSKRPLVLMTEFGDSAVIFEVWVWIDDPWRTRRAKSGLHEAIWRAFQDAGLVIAFPQLGVHLDRNVG